MKYKREVLLIITLGIFIFSLAIGSSELIIHKNSSSIEKTYSEGDYVRGRINISLTNQENKYFGSNFPGRTMLLDLLNNISGIKFDCIPKNCKDDYESNNGEANKRFSPVNKDIVGFLIGGGIVDRIESFKFNLNDLDLGQSSCINQMNVDLFNDGSIDFFNTASSAEACDSIPKNYGCFQVSDSSGLSNIVKDLYCERINLSAAPGYKLGATVRKESPNADLLTFSFYDVSTGVKGPITCTVAPNMVVGETKEAECNIDYPTSKSIVAMICIQDKTQYDLEGETGYKIRTEGVASCGGTGVPKTNYSYTSDFEIYARPLKYAPIQEMEFNAESYQELNNKDLKSEIKNYLSRIYGLDCKNNCIIPISINGSIGSAEIHSGKINYKLTSGIVSDSELIYVLSKKPFLINMNSSFIDLEKMKFEVPGVNGTHEFNLCFDQANCNAGNALISERIIANIGFSFDLLPRSVLIGQETTFVVQSSKNITSSKWKFGDNSTIVNSQDNKASHTYGKGGEYTIEITLNSRGGEISTKRFKINVGDPKQSANLSVLRSKEKMRDVNAEISSMPQWIKSEVEDHFSELDAQVREISNDYASLGQNASEEDYIEIITKLLDLRVPYSVGISEKGVFPLAIGYNNIDSSILAEISGEEDSENLKEDIISWASNNYEPEIEFETFSSNYEEGKETLLRKYKIKLNKISDIDDEIYLIIDHPVTSIKFKENYDINTIEDESAAYLTISEEDSLEQVEFLILGDEPPEVEDLAIHISPVLQGLGGASGKTVLPDYFKNEGQILWGRLIVALVVLLIVVLAIYLLLQHWYKYSYEKHLFKNPDDLYNLLNFIYNSRKTGMEDRILKEKLKEKNWKGEQITYAFKKIDGKRTGMFEIPIFKFAENKKVRKEIEKRQGGPLDARFIKI